MTAVVRPADEHAWHACKTPAPPTKPPLAWQCRICDQIWHWRQPEQPPAQWIRAGHEEAKHL